MLQYLGQRLDSGCIRRLFADEEPFSIPPVRLCSLATLPGFMCDFSAV